MKSIIRIFTLGALGLSLGACSDFFELKPQNELVLDEFWQSESDVQSVVGACYRSMQEQGFMERLLIWGEFRGDNASLGMGDGGDISNIANLNLLPSNGYAYWGDFYNVINLCNTVEHFAPIAKSKDANFSQAQLDGYLAEVKGIRAFCYFTLVRAFRDIPFTTTPTIDDTQSFQLAQSTPEEVLTFLIDDLKTAEPKAFTSWQSKESTKGRITRQALRALIADMDLWLGNYSECITYCDKVINDTQNPVYLDVSPNYFRDVFVTGNSCESIFELQFAQTSSTVSNYAVRRFYGSDGSSTPVMTAQDFSTSTLFAPTDHRQYDAVFVSKAGTCPIRKFVSYREDPAIDNVQARSYTLLNNNVLNSNWIVYRLPDIFLMKAEALTEQGSDLAQAYELVSRTYDRANPDALPGSANPEAASSQEAMRTLVLDERQRELLFEGKRYFDIIRFINRDRSRFSVIVNQYLVPKYVLLDQATVTKKLSELDALYMPIKDTELRANLLLKQNPFYKSTTDIKVEK